jgi:hypothetical protein
MLNPFKEINWRPGTSELRNFARSLIIGIPCVALLLLLIGYLRGKGWNMSLALTISGVGVVAGGLFYGLPILARPVYAAWYFLACCLGLVLGNALLALVFYVFVTGLGLVLRACGHRPIRKTPDRQATTYWVDADQPSDPNRYYRQF